MFNQLGVDSLCHVLAQFTHQTKPVKLVSTLVENVGHARKDPKQFVFFMRLLRYNPSYLYIYKVIYEGYNPTYN